MTARIACLDWFALWDELGRVCRLAFFVFSLCVCWAGFQNILGKPIFLFFLYSKSIQGGEPGVLHCAPYFLLGVLPDPLHDHANFFFETTWHSNAGGHFISWFILSWYILSWHICCCRVLSLYICCCRVLSCYICVCRIFSLIHLVLQVAGKRCIV